jgi:hypothetical protein
VETVPDELQMELIDLQNDTDLRNKFKNVVRAAFKKHDNDELKLYLY